MCITTLEANFECLSSPHIFQMYVGEYCTRMNTQVNASDRRCDVFFMFILLLMRVVMMKYVVNVFTRKAALIIPSATVSNYLPQPLMRFALWYDWRL